MEHSPAADCFEVDQLHARPVAYELTTDVKHDSAFRCLDVIPTKSEDLAASKAAARARSRKHLRGDALSPHGERPSPVRAEAPTFAVIEFRTFSDRSDVARQDSVLLCHA